MIIKQIKETNNFREEYQISEQRTWKKKKIKKCEFHDALKKTETGKIIHGLKVL